MPVDGRAGLSFPSWLWSMLDLPNDLAREAWSFLIPYVEPARAYVFSRLA
jgi:hypothetical protein